MFGTLKTLCEWRQKKQDQQDDKEFMSSAIQVQAGHLCSGDTVYICDKDNRKKHTFASGHIHNMAGSVSGNPFRKEWRGDTFSLYNHKGEKFVVGKKLHEFLYIAPGRSRRLTW